MDPERLLGSLVRSTLLGRRMPVASKVALGVGALGIALAAIEHVTEKRASQGAPGSGAAPPPPPGAPPPPIPPDNPRGQEAMLLVRAMIAAAHADGSLDEEERRAILGRLAGERLAADERETLAHELDAPWRPEDLAARVTSTRLAEEVYAASLLAIRLDSRAEREYLARLARLLGLDGESTGRLHRLLGAPRPA